jgi:hypothetical protein
MTAEIVLMNNEAVVLAADSEVSLVTGPVEIFGYIDFLMPSG